MSVRAEDRHVRSTHSTVAPLHPAEVDPSTHEPGPSIIQSRSLPLGRYPLVHTTSIDHAEELLSRLETPIRASPTSGPGAFEWRANRVVFGSLAITANAYGGCIRASTPDTGASYSLMVPLRGRAVVTAAGEAMEVEAGRRGMLLSPSSSVQFDLDRGYSGIALTVSTPTVSAAFQTLAQREPRTPLVFSLAVDLQPESKRGFLRILDFIVGEADRDPGILSSPHVVSHLAEAFVLSMVVEGAHDHRAPLEGPPRALEPAHLRRVEDYIEAHLREPITLAELVSVAGVSARTLQAGFQAHRGSTPMEFLRARRLDLARTRLLAPRRDDAVARIAADSGFDHMGRFSVSYRARYGESPRDTLVRSRPRGRRRSA